jgi:hypothetical protein
MVGSCRYEVRYEDVVLFESLRSKQIAGSDDGQQCTQAIPSPAHFSGDGIQVGAIGKLERSA